VADIPQLITELDQYATRFGPYHPETIAVAHRLAVGFWCTGEIDRAMSILQQALEGLASSVNPNDPVQLDLLCTLAEILVEQDRLEQAAAVYRDIVNLSISRSGETHPSTLAAQGDLALVLFELGRHDEAACLEGQAYACARDLLGAQHPVSCVLAWNRAQRFESNGDGEAATSIIRNELAWLLTQTEGALVTDQKMIRAMLAKRLNWDSAGAC
jgi:tetratricopeptide (TPR) repeat protein